MNLKSLMLLFRQFGDRELKENKSKEKPIRNRDVFVTKVRQLDFLLNTEEKHPQFKKKKRENLFHQLFASKLTQPRNRQVEKSDLSQN